MTRKGSTVHMEIVTDDGKKTARAIVWMSPELELALHRLAAADDRKLSDYIGVVLRRHVWGHSASMPCDGEGANSADSRT